MEKPSKEDDGIGSPVCCAISSKSCVYPIIATAFPLSMNHRVFQLGAGTALPGLVAAKIGAKSVLLTDHAEKLKTLENCLSIVSQSGCRVDVCGLTWGHFSAITLNLHHAVDIIIAADCFYESKGWFLSKT